MRGVSWAIVPKPRANTRGQSLLTAQESSALLMGEAVSHTPPHTQALPPPLPCLEDVQAGLEVVPEKPKCYS